MIARRGLMAFVAAGASLAVARTLQAQGTSAMTRAAGTITAGDVVRHISVLADDSMMGRGTPNPALEATARYVAAEFERLGLKPGGTLRPTLAVQYPSAAALRSAGLTAEQHDAYRVAYLSARYTKNHLAWVATVTPTSVLRQNIDFLELAATGI